MTFTRARLRDMLQMVPEKKGFTKMSSNAPEERPGSEAETSGGLRQPQQSPGTSVGVDMLIPHTHTPQQLCRCVWSDLHPDRQADGGRAQRLRLRPGTSCSHASPSGGLSHCRESVLRSVSLLCVTASLEPPSGVHKDLRPHQHSNHAGLKPTGGPSAPGSPGKPDRP